MKRILLTVILVFCGFQNVEAGFLTNLYNTNNNRFYNNDYRHYGNPNFNQWRGNYYGGRRYNPQYYPQNYNIQTPVISQSGIQRNGFQSNEKFITNNYSKIGNIEKRIFNRTYENDVFQNRIERLEEKIFGAIQYGNLDQRYETLEAAYKNYKAFSPDYSRQTYTSQTNNNQNYSNSYRPPIFTGSTGGGWRNMLWGNMKNQMIGMPTGFTPAMDPAYMDYFEAERMMGSGQTVDYADRNNRYRTNTQRGSGVGVTILD